MKLLNVDINKIIVNKNQPRKFFDDEKLKELSDSIKLYGLLQPIIVKEVDNGYEIIAGERRYRACLLAELSSVDVVVNDSDRYTSNNISIIENIQREDLSAIEEALAYRTLLDDYELSQVEISEAMGKSPSSISNKLRLLKLNGDVQDAIKTGKITERHGRAMLKLDDETQGLLLARTLENNYTVSVLEREVAKRLAPSKKKNISKAIVSRDFKLAINTLKQAVEMIERTGMNVEVSEEIEDDELVFSVRVSKGA